jgi:hypothetical protein
MSMFRKGTRTQSKLRLGIMAPSNGGKTMTALAIASSLGRYVVIDTENGSAEKYINEENPCGGRFAFDVLCLKDHHPNEYIKAMRAAAAEGYDAVVVDGLSAAWDYTQRLVDDEVIRTKGNSFQIWGKVGQVFNGLMKEIVASPIHVIATMRSKTEYILEENDRGKKVPKKVGMAPQVRQNSEYEFDVVLEMDHDHNCWTSKTRCRALDGKSFPRPGKELCDIINRWLSDGEAAVIDWKERARVAYPKIPKEQAEAIRLEAGDNFQLMAEKLEAAANV